MLQSWGCKVLDMAEQLNGTEKNGKTVGMVSIERL